MENSTAQTQGGRGGHAHARPKPRRSFSQRSTPLKMVSKNEDVIPPIGENLRIIPLGGVEEIGQNMTAIEYGNDIIIVDCGFQFREEETPGIDYIIPNTRYLEERKDKIRGMFITHGHLDHIGAIPYVITRIGNPPIYTRQFGAIMIAKRQEEFAHLPPLDMRIIDGDETITISEGLKVTTFPISHTIPDSMGLVIKTKMGNIVFIEDVRVDNINGVVTEEEEEQYKKFKDMDVLLLTMDSTSIEKQGFSLSEQVVIKNIEKIIREANSRLIIATFASQVERIGSILNICKLLNKKVVIEGRAMKTNIEIMKQLKLIELGELIIPMEDVEKYAPERIVMIVTGGQGEEFSALMRIANKTHKYLRLKPTDTILLSSSVIPTNVNAIVKLKDNLYRTGAKIITYVDADVHASGHGNREELRWIHNHVNYRFFMPVHGFHHMLRQHAELAYTKGTPRENVVVPDNGSVVEIYDGGQKIRILETKAPSYPVMVDGFSVGGNQEMVLRDRKMLSEDGIFVVVVSINTKTGKLRKSPDIIARGFVYVRESQDLLNRTRMLIKKSVEDTTQGMNPIDFDFVKSTLADSIARFLFQETAKKPMVIPVILGV